MTMQSHCSSRASFTPPRNGWPTTTRSTGCYRSRLVADRTVHREHSDRRSQRRGWVALLLVPFSVHTLLCHRIRVRRQLSQLSHVTIPSLWLDSGHRSFLACRSHRGGWLVAIDVRWQLCRAVRRNTAALPVLEGVIVRKKQVSQLREAARYVILFDDQVLRLRNGAAQKSRSHCSVQFSQCSGTVVAQDTTARRFTRSALFTACFLQCHDLLSPDLRNPAL